MLESLQNLLDINLEVFNNLNFINVEKEENTYIEEGSTVHVNLAQLPEEKRKEILDVPKEAFEINSRVLRESEENEAGAMERAWKPEYNEILQWFEGLLHSKHQEMLRAGLRLRGLINAMDLSKPEIDRRKEQLVERLGPEARYVANLTCAGYFDRGRVFFELYDTKFLNGEYKMHKFGDEVARVIENELIAVFVDLDDTTHDVCQEVRDTMALHQREEPITDFVDICGIGDRCHDVMDQSLELLKDEFFAMDAREWTEGEAKYVRIQVHGIQQLNY